MPTIHTLKRRLNQLQKESDSNDVTVQIITIAWEGAPEPEYEPGEHVCVIGGDNPGLFVANENGKLEKKHD